MGEAEKERERVLPGGLAGNDGPAVSKRETEKAGSGQTLPRARIVILRGTALARFSFGDIDVGRRSRGAVMDVYTSVSS